MEYTKLAFYQKKILKPLDYAIIVLALFLVVLSFLALFQNNTTGANIIVTNSNAEWIYNLQEDKVFGTQGTIGVSVIAIENNTAFFVSSPCTNQICVHSNPIMHNGSFIACLPNQVFVRIESDESLQSSTLVDDELDAVGF